MSPRKKQAQALPAVRPCLKSPTEPLLSPAEDREGLYAALEKAFDQTTPSSRVLCGQLVFEAQMCSTQESHAFLDRQKLHKSHFADNTLRRYEKDPTTDLGNDSLRDGAIHVVYDEDLPFAFLTQQDSKRVGPLLQLSSEVLELYPTLGPSHTYCGNYKYTVTVLVDVHTSKAHLPYLGIYLSKLGLKLMHNEMGRDDWLEHEHPAKNQAPVYMNPQDPPPNGIMAMFSSALREMERSKMQDFAAAMLNEQALTIARYSGMMSKYGYRFGRDTLLISFVTALCSMRDRDSIQHFIKLEGITRIAFIGRGSDADVRNVADWARRLKDTGLDVWQADEWIFGA